MPRPFISFDAAGTLIQVRQPVGRTYAEFAGAHGVQVTEKALNDAFRMIWRETEPPLRPEGTPALDDDRSWWQQLAYRVFEQASGRPVPMASFEPLFDALYTHFAQPEAWTVFEDVVPVLSELSQDHALCVLSNFDRRLLNILEGHQLMPFFEHVILSSEVGASKPHARMFETALRVMDGSPSSGWHVGDDLRCDIQGAQNQGWNAYAVVRPAQGLDALVEKVRKKLK